MPIISFNSSNIPETLFESMLFGHKKGAFTGAYADKKGAFEAADKGTIFFDEISNISTEIQAKILRVLQEKEIQPLGSNKTFKVDVRIIAATNVDLRERIKTNEFREDLFFRLNVIDIKLPSLRERKEDIPLLVSHFLEKYNKENDKNLNVIPKIFMKHMVDYNWPGNIRELENAINRVVLLSPKNELDYKTLPYEIINFDPEFDTDNNHNNDFNTQIELYKKKLIIRALNECNWIQKKAALSLGLKATTLSELMKRLEITK
jgi:two-component system response regulator PilR (NtrC family)